MPKKIGLINLPLQNDTAFYPLIWLIIKTTIETKSNNKFDFLEANKRNYCDDFDT
jgi:hypothetical protein